jgi:hypothetical protein
MLALFSITLVLLLVVWGYFSQKIQTIQDRAVSVVDSDHELALWIDYAMSLESALSERESMIRKLGYSVESLRVSFNIAQSNTSAVKLGKVKARSLKGRQVIQNSYALTMPGFDIPDNPIMDDNGLIVTLPEANSDYNLAIIELYNATGKYPTDKLDIDKHVRQIRRQNRSIDLVPATQPVISTPVASNDNGNKSSADSGSFVPGKIDWIQIRNTMSDHDKLDRKLDNAECQWLETKVSDWNSRGKSFDDMVKYTIDHFKSKSNGKGKH